MFKVEMGIRDPKRFYAIYSTIGTPCGKPETQIYTVKTPRRTPELPKIKQSENFNKFIPYKTKSYNAIPHFL